MTSKASKAQRRLAVGIVLTTPLLAAPYFPSCGRSHGTFPSACMQPGVGNCPAGTPEQNDQVEAALQQAQATSVVSIGTPYADWSALEKCMVGMEPPPGTQIYQGADPRNDQVTITCSRNLDAFRIPLRQFVAAPDPGNPDCNGGRVGIINLAPIFSAESRLPRYLEDARFNGSSPVSEMNVLQSFKDLWDAVLVELGDPVYVNDPGNPPDEPADRANWIISIGNEIDMYLNGRRAPYPAAGAQMGACGPNEPGQNDCYLDPPTRWADYAEFYTEAAAYVKSTADAANVPVSVGTTVRWGAELDPPPAHYSGDDVCGPYELFVHSSMSTDCTYFGVPSAPSSTVYTDEIPAVLVSYFAMAGASNVYVYTRYFPQSLGEPPQPTTDPDLFGPQYTLQLVSQFANMGTWSSDITAEGATAIDLPIVIQEIGYPSSFGSAQSQNIADQHLRAVDAAFNAWNIYHDDFVPTLNLPPVLSLNWFQLHDFAPQLCPGNFPFQACEWGLFTSDHQEKKHPNDAWSSWVQFGLLGISQNPPEQDPKRSCALQ